MSPQDESENQALVSNEPESQLHSEKPVEVESSEEPKVARFTLRALMVLKNRCSIITLFGRYTNFMVVMSSQ